MSILQTQIDSVVVDVETAKALASFNYSIAGLNGIYNIKLEGTIVKLQVILDELNRYDLVNYEDSYFYSLKKESTKYCRPKEEATQSPPEEAFYHRRYLITSTGAGAGAGIEVGFTLPSRSTYLFVNINLLGYNTLTLGDGVTDKESYFSSDSGVTAKGLNNLAANDELYLNANVIGSPISLIDQIEITLL